VPQDVILPRVLDDGTFATLSSLMLFNNVEVLMALTQDKRFFPELFGRLKELSGGPQKGDAAAGGDQAWTDLVAFLQVGAQPSAVLKCCPGAASVERSRCMLRHDNQCLA